MIKNPDYTREGKYDDAASAYSDYWSKQMGFYVDQFTVMSDTRTIDEILSQKPKCCMPGWKPLKPNLHITNKIDPETNELCRELDKITARIRRLSRLRTGRENE